MSSLVSGRLVLHGDFFSVFADLSDCFWVVSNSSSSSFGPFLDYSEALSIMASSNASLHSYYSKGVMSYERLYF